MEGVRGDTDEARIGKVLYIFFFVYSVETERTLYIYCSIRPAVTGAVGMFVKRSRHVSHVPWAP